MSRYATFPSSLPSIVVSFCLACGAVLLLTACGQKGPLKPTAPAPTAEKQQTPTAPAPDKK